MLELPTFNASMAMLIGTKRWILLIEGELPPEVDENTVRFDATSISIPLRMLGIVSNSRLIVGSREQVDSLLKDFPG